MIKPFTFQTVPMIHMKWSGSRSLSTLVANHYSLSRILIVTTDSLVDIGTIDPICENLKQAGYQPHIYSQIESDPSQETVLACTKFAKEQNIELVIGIGGGSVLDVAKMVAVLLPTTQNIGDMYGIDKVQNERSPLILLPTTSGTGSEVTNISILTVGTDKMGVVSNQLYCDIILLDAELTVGLPRIHTAASGIDAMVHAIEAYTSSHLKNPISDALSREALRLLSNNLIQACENGTDRTARENMALGSLLAGQSFSNSPVAAVHALAYPLGGRYHIPHGVSNALMLRDVLRYNSVKVAHLYAELGLAMGRTSLDNPQAQCDDFIQIIEGLIMKSGVPTSLRDAGVKKEDLPMLANDAMKQTRLLRNNPVQVTEEDALKLYQQAF